MALRVSHGTTARSTKLCQRGMASAQYYCWDPFTGEQRFFATADELDAYEEGLQLLAGMLVEPECPACDTREPHDVDQQRCMELQTRRADLQRAGRYHGPISPFDLPCGQALRTMFPAEHATHRRRVAQESSVEHDWVWILSLPAVGAGVGKRLRLRDLKHLRCCARGLKSGGTLELAVAWQCFERLRGTATAISPRHGPVRAEPPFLYRWMPVYDDRYGYAQASAAPNFHRIQVLDFPDAVCPITR